MLLVRRKIHTKAKLNRIRVSISLVTVGNGLDFPKTLSFSWGDIDDFTISIAFKGKSVTSISANGIERDYAANAPVVAITNGLIPRLLYPHNDYLTDEDNDTEERLMDMLGDPIYRNFILLVDGIYRRINKKSRVSKYICEQITKPGFEPSKDFDVERFLRLMLVNSVNNIIDSVNLFLLNMAGNITYIQPLRAITQRYYRFQNFAVSDIDSSGNNLPMFFNSLPNETMEEFNQWISPTLGVEIAAYPNEGHIELTACTATGEKHNLVDMGFGYTQILPILTMMWKAIYVDSKLKHNYCKDHIVAIEQPELHLHPRLQSLFAEVLCRSVEEGKQKEIRPRFIIETHSEVIVNRIGELIAEGKIDADDVNVVIFNGKNEGLEHYVQPTTFTKDGYLNEWPYGFFSGN